MRVNTFLIVIIIACISCSQVPKKPDFLSGPFVSVQKGMVVSAHPESSRIGVEILQKGGNAIDAAIATQLALAVCYPEAGNIGGGGFMVIRMADGKTDALDFREKGPGKATRDMYLDSKGEVIKGLSLRTQLAAGVPGTIDGMFEAHKKYGKLPFRDIIQPAIDLAEKGYPLPATQASSLNSGRKTFLERNVSKTAFVKDSMWKEGDILIQPELAATLKLIRDLGRDGFYSGKTAALLVKEMIRGNGIITEQDLTDYKSVWRPPLTGDYRGFRIISVPPPSSGGVILQQLLGMVSNYDLKGLGFHSYQSIHIMIEAERRAFADRAEYLGDPDFVSVPVDKLLNPKYLSDRMKTLDISKASLSSDIGHGQPEGYVSGETTHFSVVDPMGNAVSVTTTLNDTFGSSIVVEGAGFLLNNEMDDFSSKPGFPNMYGLIGGEANSIKPGKRILSSMTPTIVEKEGKLFLVLGSPGGSTIPTSVFQVIINSIDYNMNITDAVGVSRFHNQWLPDETAFERNRFDSVLIGKLASMGHKISLRGSLGRVNAIMLMPDGTLVSGADPRGNNIAAGF